MVRPLFVTAFALAGLAVCFAGEAPEPEKPATLEPGTYAHIQTAKGEIVFRLFTELTPRTAENFIQLARGERPFKTPEGRWVQRPFYDGLTFHRIEDGDLKLIQGGCPEGDGTGGPGYQIDGETTDELTFDEPGMVAMANSGRPNTAGSQFFITAAPATQLKGRYTVFGQVVRGHDVVEAISQMAARAKRSGRSTIHLARDPVVMTAVTIEEVEPEAPAEVEE
ncbi:MAG: peptidylprolyl isomerase [Planctomycetota bacterium]